MFYNEFVINEYQKEAELVLKQDHSVVKLKNEACAGAAEISKPLKYLLNVMLKYYE